jgi:late competence protein required for DNA uptake (superfamily II DNA/RNA helicase)
MRNRGVEICLLSPRIDELYDVILLLQQRGLFGILFIYSILRQQTRDLT